MPEGEATDPVHSAQGLSFLRMLRDVPRTFVEVRHVCGYRFYGAILLLVSGAVFAFWSPAAQGALGLYVLVFVLWSGAIAVSERRSPIRGEADTSATLGEWFATASLLAAALYATDFAAAAFHWSEVRPAGIANPWEEAGRWTAWFGGILFLPVATALLSEFLVRLPYGRRRVGGTESLGLLVVRLGVASLLISEVFESTLVAYPGHLPPFSDVLAPGVEAALLWCGLAAVMGGLAILLLGIAFEVYGPDARELHPRRRRTVAEVVATLARPVEQLGRRLPRWLGRVSGPSGALSRPASTSNDERRRLSWFLYAIFLFVLMLPLWAIYGNHPLAPLLFGAYAVLVFPWSASRAMNGYDWPGSSYRRAFVFFASSLVVGLLHKYLDKGFEILLDELVPGALLLLLVIAALSQSTIHRMEAPVGRLFSFFELPEEAIQEAQEAVAEARTRLARAESKAEGRLAELRLEDSPRLDQATAWTEGVRAARESLESVERELTSIRRSHHAQ